MKIFSFIFTLISFVANAQFTSPGTGVSYTLSSLSAAAPTVLVNNGTSYSMTANITISAGDTLLMNENTTLIINPGIKLTLAGTYNTIATNLLITSGNPASVFNGIQFDAGSNVQMKNTTLEYGGGIRVSTGNFLMDNCIVRNFKSGLVTASAISFSTGSPVVQNSQFLENDLAAFSSGANQTVSAIFSNNYLFQNSKTNGNRPQINMGPTGTDSLKIVNNTVLGNPLNTNVGGISVAALAGGTVRVRISGNTVQNNRYGINIQAAGAAGIIKGNIIQNNNIQNNPAQGGSGISLYATSDQLYITQNQIRGNLWGITFPTSGTANLGSDTPGNTNIGQNIFYNNGNGGNTYALYNNSTSSVMAKFNCWRENEQSTDAMVEAVIFHQVDDAAKGLVTFSPYNCSVMGTNEAILPKNALYPNPNNGKFFFEAPENGNIAISDMSGKLIHSQLIRKGKNEILISAILGSYFLVYHFAGKKSTVKFLVK